MIYPTLDITINGKDRVKRTNEPTPKVYLENNQEFGLELFNPTGDVLLAKIRMNGKLISHSGLIIKPGERVFLDRYIDTTDKFRFTSYDVEAGNADVEKAIASNGMVEVEWFKERQIKNNPIQFIYTSSSQPVWKETSIIDVLNENNSVYNSNISYGADRDNLKCYNTENASTLQNCACTMDSLSIEPSSYCYSTSVSSSSINGQTVTTTASSTYKNGALVDEDHKTFYQTPQTVTKKTGRIGKGGESDQELEYNNDYAFEYWKSYHNALQILPIENKPLTAKELAERPIYCTNCGKKLHKKYKYCPSCGQKI